MLFINPNNSIKIKYKDNRGLSWMSSLIMYSQEKLFNKLTCAFKLHYDP